jgi:hypothetical protein
MVTLVVRALHAPKLWLPLRGVARVGSVILTLLEVFAEAQRQAYEAKQRYPFIGW